MRRPVILALLVLVILSTAAVAARNLWTRLPTDAEVVALEEAINALPGVAAAEGGGSGSTGDLHVRVDLDGDIGPDPAATATVEVVDLLRGEAFAGIDDTVLTVTAGEGLARSGLPSAQLEITFRSRPEAVGLADEVRLWRELRARFGRVTMRVAGDGSEGVRDRSVSVEVPGTGTTAVDTMRELARLSWPPTSEPSAWGVGTDGPSFSATSSFPPAQVVEAMRRLSVAPGGLVGADDRIWMAGRWDGASGCLAVELAVSLAEFGDVPIRELDAATVRDRTARLTREHLARLDASGVPYSFRAYAPGHRSGSEAGDLDLVQISGCGTG
jgi:hypothetical protein